MLTDNVAYVQEKRSFVKSMTVLLGFSFCLPLSKGLVAIMSSITLSYVDKQKQNLFLVPCRIQKVVIFFLKHAVIRLLIHFFEEVLAAIFKRLTILSLP